jgi:hypothetical protein
MRETKESIISNRMRGYEYIGTITTVKLKSELGVFIMERVSTYQKGGEEKRVTQYYVSTDGTLGPPFATYEEALEKFQAREKQLRSIQSEPIP